MPDQIHFCGVLHAVSTLCFGTAKEGKEHTPNCQILERLSNTARAQCCRAGHCRSRGYRGDVRLVGAHDAAHNVGCRGARLVLSWERWEDASRQLCTESLVKAAKVAVPAAYKMLKLALSLNPKNEFL